MKAKPFIKWVGGKGQPIKHLEALFNLDARQAMYLDIISHWNKKTKPD
jgi:site-specific DNA-adenine methylase